MTVTPNDPGPQAHPDLAPLSFLIGRWRGTGVVGYTTIETARFGQELTSSDNGKAFLNYSSRTWLLDEEGKAGRPLGTEAGYLSHETGGRLEVLLVHPTGIS